MLASNLWLFDLIVVEEVKQVEHELEIKNKVMQTTFISETEYLKEQYKEKNRNLYLMNLVVPKLSKLIISQEISIVNLRAQLDQANQDAYEAIQKARNRKPSCHSSSLTSNCIDSLNSELEKLRGLLVNEKSTYAKLYQVYINLKVFVNCSILLL